MDVTFPEMGDSVAEGTILEWRVKAGDTVAVDDPLVEISTDKVDAEAALARRRHGHRAAGRAGRDRGGGHRAVPDRGGRRRAARRRPAARRGRRRPARRAARAAPPAATATPTPRRSPRAWPPSHGIDLAARERQRARAGA